MHILNKKYSFFQGGGGPMDIQYIYTFGREFTKYTVIIDVYIRFWPNLDIAAGI